MPLLLKRINCKPTDARVATEDEVCSLLWNRICVFSKKKAQGIYQMQTLYFVGIVYILNGMYFLFCLFSVTFAMCLG